MTIIRQGTGPSLTGMVGAIVIVQFNGKTYMRRAPQRQKDAWTPNQLLHRQRFSKVNGFCNQFKYSLIPQIWNDAAVRMSGYALFLKTNMAAFGPDGSVTDPKRIRLSTGKLPWPEGFQVQRMAGDSSTIQVSWLKDAHLGGNTLKDELMVISAADVYSEITGTGIVRMDLGGTFEIPELSKAATPIYFFFASKDGRNYSESSCFEI
jgi:hypothetical protein